MPEFSIEIGAESLQRSDGICSPTHCSFLQLAKGSCIRHGVKCTLITARIDNPHEFDYGRIESEAIVAAVCRHEGDGIYGIRPEWFDALLQAPRVLAKPVKERIISHLRAAN